MSYATYPPTPTTHDRQLEQARLRLQRADTLLDQARRADTAFNTQETAAILYQAECAYNAALENFNNLNQIIPA